MRQFPVWDVYTAGGYIKAVDRPIAPACMASRTRLFIRSSSSELAWRSTSPRTIRRTWVCPTVCTMLSGIPAFSSTVKYSFMVDQPALAARLASNGASDCPSPALMVVIP